MRLRPVPAALSAATLSCCALSVPAFAQAGDPPDLQNQVQSMAARLDAQALLIRRLQREVDDLRMRERAAGYTHSLVQAQSLAASPAAGASAPVAAQPAMPQPSLSTNVAAAGEPAAPAVGEEQQRSSESSSRSAAEVAAQGHAPLFQRNWTLNLGWTYSYYDRRQLALSGFLALDAIFLGNIDITQTKAQLWTLNMGGTYGVSPNLSLTFNVPWVYRTSRFIAAGQQFAANQSSQADVSSASVGDVSLGANYRFVQQHGNWPDLIGTFTVTAPTGTSPFGIATVQPNSNNTNLQVPTRLPTGNGLWSVAVGASVLKTVDPVVMYANLGYLYYVPRSFGVIDPLTFNEPGTVKLGSGIQLGAGFALVVNDRTSVSTGFQSLITRDTQIKAAGQGYQTIPGSAENATSLNFGLNYVLSKHLTLSGSLAVGITPDAPNYTIGISFPYRF